MYIVFSDIHSNATALKEFYNYIVKNYKKDKTKLIFIGDLIGYLKTDTEFLDIVEEMKEKLNIEFIIGNHDNALIESFKSENIEKSEVLNNTILENKKFKDRLLRIYGYFNHKPIKINIGNKKIVLSHGGLNDCINGYYYENSDFQKIIDFEDNYDLYIMGHIHRPFIKKFNGKNFINVGSIGMSRDRDYRSAYLEINEIGNCKIKRMSYNIDIEYMRNIEKENKIKNRLYYGGNSKYIEYKLLNFSKEDKRKIKKNWGKNTIFNKGIYFKSGYNQCSLLKIKMENGVIKYIYSNGKQNSEFNKIEEIIKRRCK